ncbi:hypothetical protein FRC07_004877, partial [Ceratobasidium sp. 392]
MVQVAYKSGEPATLLFVLESVRIYLITAQVPIHKPTPLCDPLFSPPPATPEATEGIHTPDELPATLGETEVWVKRHPSSGLPSGYATQKPQQVTPSQTARPTSHLPPFFPLRTHTDFIQAEIFSQNGCSDNLINDQLRMLHETGAYSGMPASKRLTLKNAADYHNTLRTAAGASEQFIDREITTQFKGREYKHTVNFRPIFPVLSDIVSDPELFKMFVLHPEQPYIRRSENDPTPMRYWEELQHGEDWWYMQDSIASDHHILFICTYIDETNVSTIGGVDVWPVYAWIGNLPAATRKQRTKKGGAVLIGYLPEASKGDVPLNDTDLAELRNRVYHDALEVMFESLKIPAQHGVPMRCGDGAIRIFHPTIGVISADYKELTWEPRTVEGSQDLVASAQQATTLKRRDEILHEQSLRISRNVFHEIMPPFFSVYRAVAADPLHQIEQGIFGKHIWPLIKETLSPKQATILDSRFKKIPRYPDLKHFPNGVTSLKNVTGNEHAVILRLLPPLIEDLLPSSTRHSFITVLRSLAKIHLSAKFTTHTEASLEELDQEIALFSGAYAKLALVYESIATNYPKLHSLSHLVDIIRRKSTTDNYHTGIGEALHPQSKKDYRHTNHQDTFKEQMLRTYQERELLIRIRARIDQQNSTSDGDSLQQGEMDSSDGRIEFNRHPIKKLTTTFARELIKSDPEAKHFIRELRTFLYEEVGGFGTAFHFRAQALPHLDGTTVALHKTLRISYVSLLDSRTGLDVVRISESWRGKGPRKDYVLFNGKHGLSVAQLLA